MKAPLSLPFALLLLPIVLTSQAVPASLQGTVVDGVSSRGIVGATVLLTGIAGNRIVSFTTKTKAGGAFVFEKIPSSSGYWLVAMHGDDHVKTIYRQRGLNGIGAQIPVGVGEQIRDIRLEMIPTGEISGRVLDANGKALSDAQVLIMRPYHQEGVRLLRGVKGTVRTNRRGEYRVSGLAPGQYYVRVAMPRFGGFEVDPGIFPDVPRLRDLAAPSWLPIPLRNVPDKESEGYPLIFFPGVADEHAARAVDLRAGGQGSGVDIVVSRVHTRRVRGTIVDMATGTVIPKADVFLFRRNSARGSPPARTATSEGGSFDLRNILPGSYIMVGTSSDGKTPLRGAIALDIRDTDVNNLRVPLTAGLDLSGKVSIEAAGRRADDLLHVVVTLRPDAPSTTGLLPSPTFIEPAITGNVNYAEAGLRPMAEIPPVRAASDGILAFRGISPWDYAVEVSHPLEDTYVKSIRLGAIDVLGNGLHVDGRFRDTLDVVLASPAGRIEGRLVNAVQKGVDAMPVVLVPDAQHRGRRDLYRNGLTDDDGRFQFGNLPPGDYRLFAWEFIEEGSWLDSEFLRLYEDKGTPVHVDQGSREVVEVQPIPAWY